MHKAAPKWGSGRVDVRHLTLASGEATSKINPWPPGHEAATLLLPQGSTSFYSEKTMH